MITRIRNLRTHLPHLPRALGLIYHAAPGLALAWIGLLLIQGLLPALTISLTRLLVNRLVDLIGRVPFSSGIPWPVLTPTLLLTGGLGFLMLLSQLLQSLSGYIHTIQSEQVGIQVSKLIQEKAIQTDFSLFETPAQSNKLYRARLEAAYRPVAVLDSLGMLAQGGVTLISILVLLLPYGLWLPLVLLASSLPVLWVVMRYRRKQHAWQKQVSAAERRAWYYDWLLTSEEAAAELRLFGTGSLFIRLYADIRARLKADRLRLERSQIGGQLVAGVIGLLAAAGCMAYMLWRALNGLAQLGDLVLFYQVLTQGQSVLRSLLQNAGQLYGSLLFLGNLFEFLDLENAVVDPAEPAPLPAASQCVDLHCQDVTFNYPGSDRPALDHFNLHIPAGQIAAVVGDNGAGKSTLLKLICRLYDPQQGCITWNGTNLRDLAQEELRNRITILFQEPMQYQAAARENIGYSASKNRHSTGEVDIIQAAEGAGADSFVRDLPQGYDTPLGKWFEEGTDLSVGQWQRIALARAFLRRSPLMLLDEPTSAMDAWAEAEWLTRLRTLSAGRTTLIITHRLTTAMQADIIHVMVAGRIIESGTHSELVARGGRYARAWLSQTRAMEFSA